MEYKEISLDIKMNHFIRTEWWNVFKDTIKHPDINLCFFNKGKDIEEKMVVVDDSKSILVLIKLIRNSTGNLINTVYFIPKSKVEIIETLTGKVIVPIGIYDNYSYLNKYYQDNNIIGNIYDYLSYYIPVESGNNLHAANAEKKTERGKTPDEKLNGILTSQYEQDKRIRFGMYLISVKNILNF